jgi:hypothetical protein
MKIWMTAVVAFLVCGLVNFAEAKKPADGTKPDKGVKGQIVSVSADGTNIVVKTAGKKGTEMTITTDTKTKVTIDGVEGKLSDLKADEYVMVSPSVGTAETIKATTKKPEKKPAA